MDKKITYEFLVKNAIEVKGAVNSGLFFYMDKYYGIQWSSGLGRWVIALENSPFTRYSDGLVVFLKDWQKRGFKPEYFTAINSGDKVHVNGITMDIVDFWSMYYMKP